MHQNNLLYLQVANKEGVLYLSDHFYLMKLLYCILLDRARGVAQIYISVLINS